MNKKLLQRSLLNSLAVLLYTLAVSLIMQRAEDVFGPMNDILGPAAFLMLFVLSAAIVGSLIFGQPIILFLDNQKKSALQLLAYTLFWLFLLTVIVLTVQFFI